MKRMAAAVAATVVVGLTWAGVARADEAGDEALAPYADSELEPSQRPEPETEVRSPGLIAGGSVLLASGVAGGIALAVHASRIQSGGGFMDFSGLDKILFGAASFLSFGAGLGGGIPMIAVGARRYPVHVPLPKDELATRAMPKVGVGPTSVTMEWSF